MTPKLQGGLNSSVILTSLDYNNYTGKLLSYLEPVLLSSEWSRFVKCWHAKTDGWAASTFHSNCDGRGPTVTIIKVNDSIFGGYTDVSWSSSCFWSYATKAFLFSFNNIKGYNPVKLTQYRNQQHAMYTCSSYGPTFGSGFDIKIHDDAVNNQRSYTLCGGTYSNPKDYLAGNCGFFTGSYYFIPSDIEVFFEIGGLGASDILGSLDPNKYLGKLISFLDPVLPTPSHGNFFRCWHAKTDGWAASTFHNNCDGRGPTVTIIKVNDYIFGGYTDVSWSGAGSCAGYSYASKAFIFSLYNVKGYNPVKLTQYQNQQYAMYRCNTHGPTFGAGCGHNIHISDDSRNNGNSHTRCGCTYTTPSGYSTGDCGFFTGGSHFSPTDVEVFYEAGGLSASIILRGLDPNKYLGKLISFLDPVLPTASRTDFVRCWHAKTDGWAASTFHSNCGGRGPTVTIIKVNDYIFGGYTDVSWSGGRHIKFFKRGQDKFIGSTIIPFGI
nr:uncharacterized protein LOC131773682 [Pocillopora verrucosa]